jgi:amidase
MTELDPASQATPGETTAPETATPSEAPVPAAPSATASDSDITHLEALEIARRVRAREISPVEVVEAHLAAIERANPVVNAVCTLAADQALAAARALAASLAAGREAGPLAGVPVGIKDLTSTAGIRTTYGSMLYADNVPAEDALVVQRIKAAGAIVIGKTNTSEFGAGANTFNPVFGATRNPWNTALSASGSTGGGASGLRCGMFALAEGSDFGGSLRTPAAFCGVVGMRPSPGLVPRYPSVRPWDILSVAGPMARSVTDLAGLLQVMAGPSPLSPLVVPTDGRDFVAAARAGIKPGMRIAYCADAPRIGVDSEIERICRAAAFALQSAGASVEEVELDLSIGRTAFIQLRGQAQLSQHLNHLGKLDKIGANLVGNIRLGLAQSPRDVAQGEHGQAQIFHAFRRLFEKYDCLITPCTAVAPFPVERNYPETINGQPMKTYIDWVAPTFVVTLAGLPAMSVPCGFTAANLPVGLQVVGPRWGEEVTLGVAKVVEDAHPVGFPQVGSAP